MLKKSMLCADVTSDEFLIKFILLFKKFLMLL